MWTCVKCGTKVDPSFDVCWSCGTSRDGLEDPSFVPADEAAPIQDPIYDPISQPMVGPEGELPEPFGTASDLVEAYQAYSLMESKFLADQLNEAGIPALTDTQDLQDFMGVMDGNPRVWVKRVDHEKARAWLAEYEKNRNTDHGHPSHLHE